MVLKLRERKLESPHQCAVLAVPEVSGLTLLLCSTILKTRALSPLLGTQLGSPGGVPALLAWLVGMEWRPPVEPMCAAVALGASSGASRVFVCAAAGVTM